MKLNISVDEDTATVTLEGRLDSNSSPELEGALKDVSESPNLILDMANLAYLSSAGLRVLLGAHKQKKAMDGELVIRNANNTIQEIFDLTGFSTIFTIV